MKRVTGIEPVYPAWKAGVLTDVLHPLESDWNRLGLYAPFVNAQARTIPPEKPPARLELATC